MKICHKLCQNVIFWGHVRSSKRFGRRFYRNRNYFKISYFISYPAIWDQSLQSQLRSHPVQLGLSVGASPGREPLPPRREANGWPTGPVRLCSGVRNARAPQYHRFIDASLNLFLFSCVQHSLFQSHETTINFIWPSKTKLFFRRMDFRQ